MRFFLLSCCCLHCSADEQKAPAQQQTEGIDSRLKELHALRHQARLKSMQEEISGQPLMFEEWEKYAEHIKSSEKYEEEAKKIQQEIDLLEAQRKQLLNEQNSLHQKP